MGMGSSLPEMGSTKMCLLFLPAGTHAFVTLFALYREQGNFLSMHREIKLFDIPGRDVTYQILPGRE
jgi:hypothetical protein